jgi:hypothetical protein
MGTQQDFSPLLKRCCNWQVNMDKITEHCVVCVQDAEQKQGSRGENEEQKRTEVAPQFILINFLRFFKNII